MARIRARLTSTSRRVRRAVLVHRRLLAAVLTAVAVLAGLRAVAPPDPPRTSVLVASRDLPSGTVLAIADLRTALFPPGTAPAGALGRADSASVVGRTLAVPLVAGEPVLPLRLVGPDLAAAYAPRVAVPVRLPDADVAALLRVGDRIDLLVSDPQAAVGGSSGGSAGGGLSGSASVVATGVPVLAAPGAPTGADGVTGSGTAGTGPAGFGGRLVVVGVLPAEVPRVADAAVRGFLSIAWTR